MQENLRARTGAARLNRYHLATADGGMRHGRLGAPDTIAGAARCPRRRRRGPQAVKIAAGPLPSPGARTSAPPSPRSAWTPALLRAVVGTSPADARIVQNNVLPLREPEMITDERRRYELPSVAVEVPQGESLFLTVTPVSDMFGGFNSRTPGVVQLSNMKVRLPTVG